MNSDEPIEDTLGGSPKENVEQMVVDARQFYEHVGIGQRGIEFVGFGQGL